MAVFRVEKNKGYTVMSNHHLRNKELSLKAKGLLSQMLSLPEDWDYTLAGLSLINREKIDAIREAVRELENAGYIQRSRERDEKGRLRGTTYVIYEQPPKLDLPTLEKPTLDNPTLEKPTLENPTQLNKELLKTNLPKKEKLNTDISSTHSIPFRSLNPSPLEDAAQPPERKRKETEPSAFDIYEEIIKDNIEYDHFVRYRSCCQAACRAAAFASIFPLSYPGKRIGLRICHNGLQAHKRFAGLAVALCFQYSQGSEGKCSFRRLLSCGFHFCLSALLLWLARKLQSHTKVLVFLP